MIHGLNLIYKETQGFEDIACRIIYLFKSFWTLTLQSQILWCHWYRGILNDTAESELFFVMTSGSFLKG